MSLYSSNPEHSMKFPNASLLKAPWQEVVDHSMPIITQNNWAATSPASNGTRNVLPPTCVFVVFLEFSCVRPKESLKSTRSRKIPVSPGGPCPLHGADRTSTFDHKLPPAIPDNSSAVTCAQTHGFREWSIFPRPVFLIPIISGASGR
jgi:hypothetical protein